MCLWEYCVYARVIDPTHEWHKRQVLCAFDYEPVIALEEAYELVGVHAQHPDRLYLYGAQHLRLDQVELLEANMPKPERQPLVSVTKNDLIRQTFRCGGKGGQNVNKVETGVRFIHEPSGAVAEGREHRTQGQNERAAFERLAKHPKMLAWLKLETARKMGQLAEAERRTDEAMHPSNLRIEGKVDGRWVPIEEAQQKQEEQNHG